ncbi:hypothetical protein MAR_028228 [Mya arenaria]|uniref:Uncharacterized protein n=1 Tax=Mya arenaria TaxID=6604 RepID=A0ABY7DE08_MYAAR|nr:hypothetical protein MAR_028228 [Mya arenaria]
MYLKPSEIFYSQDSINNVFTSGHKGTYIGDTLDRIIEGRLSYDSLPTITVTKRPGSNKWTTLDNRRLWIFHHLQAQRLCDKIYVNTREYENLSSWDRKKFTNSDGITIITRRNPGGKWHRKISPVRPQDSINNVFTSGHKGTYIGDTLDRIIEGRLSYDSLPTITVTKRSGSNKWTTLDNRRLWIFHHLQAQGLCDKIYVNTREYENLSSWDRRKFTNSNGITIITRRNPGGKWHKKISPVRPKCEDPEPLRVTEQILNHLKYFTVKIALV